MNSQIEIPTTDDLSPQLTALITKLQDLATTATADDVQLAKLALETEAAAVRVGSDLSTLFARVETARPSDLGPLQQTMKRLGRLHETDFYRAVHLLLLIEIDRQRSLIAEERSSANALEVLKALASYPFSPSFAPERFVLPDLPAWMLCELSTTFPGLDATPLLRGTRPARDFLAHCRSFLPAQADVLSLDVLWDGLERWLGTDNANLYQIEDAWIELATMLTEAGDLHRAAALIERLPKPHTRAQGHAVIASVLFASGRDEEALAWTHQETEYPHVLAEELDAEVGRRIASGRLASARSIASSLEQLDHRSARLAEVAVAYLDHHQPQNAVGCLKAAVDAAEDHDSLNPLLDPLEAFAGRRCEVGEKLKVEFDKEVERIWMLTEKNKEGPKGHQIRSSLARIWAALGKTQQALTLAAELDSLESVECRAAIASQGQPDKGRGILDEALGIARQITESRDRCAALLAVAHGLATIGSDKTSSIFYETFAAAREALAEREGYPIVKMLANIFYCLAATPKWEQRSEVFSEALEMLAELTNDEWKSQTLAQASVLFPVLHRSGEKWGTWIERYYKVAETIDYAPYRAEALGELAKVLTKHGCFENVVTCLGKIDDKNRVTVKVELAEALLAAKQPERAAQMLSDADVLARQVARQQPTALEEDVAQALAKCGLLSRAQNFADGIEDPRQRSLALSKVAFEALRHDDRAAAREALLRAMPQAVDGEIEVTSAFEPADLEALGRAMAPHDPDGRLRQQLFRAALERISRLRDPEQWDEAVLSWVRSVTLEPLAGREALLNEVTAKIHRLSPESRREHLLSELAEILVAVGETQRVSRLVETLSSKLRYARLLAAVAREKALAGKERLAHGLLTRALEAIATSEPSVSGRPFQSNLLPAICALKDEGLRQDLMQRAIHPLYQIELDTERARALLDFGKTLMESTEEVWIAEYLSEFIQAIEKAEMPALVLDLEERRIALLARAGDIDEAMASARRIDPKNWQHPNALVRIIRELVAQKQIAAAFRVLDRIYPEPCRVEALGAIIDGSQSGSVESGEPTTLFFEKYAEIEDVAARSELLRTWLEGCETPLAEELEATVNGELAKLQSAIYEVETWDARTKILFNVVKAQALLGEIERALEILEEVDAGEMAAPALGALSAFAVDLPDASAKRRIFQAVRSSLETFEDEGAFLAGLANLAEASFRGGLVEDALAILTEGVEACRRLRPVRSSSLIELTRPLTTGLAAEAPQLVADLLSLTVEIPAEDEQVEALVALAGALPRPEDVLKIDAERIRGRTRLRFLGAWRQALLALPEPPLAALRATLACFPEEPGAGLSGLSCLAAALLQSGATAAYDSLAQDCPTLGLPQLQ